MFARIGRKVAGSFLKRASLAVLVAVAVLGLVAAWWHYPAENHFSILRCTISFLGSPDANRNPDGWRYYQVGMTALVLLLFHLAWERHGRLRAQIGMAAVWSSTAMFVSLALILLAVWIPDTRQGQWFGMRTGQFHTRLAIVAIPFMAFAIVVDGVALGWAGVRSRALWPFHLYGLITLVGAWQLIAWERMCKRDPTLRHWPGDGWHSTPLWEWIIFIYLVGFLAWMAYGRLLMTEKRSDVAR